jgi:hypothetical protein
MAVIKTLTKKGTILKHEVCETVEEIWLQLNYRKCSDMNLEEEYLNHDFIIATKPTGKVIIQKRFINSIE